jgi:poly-gamma-glutamate synthesis protein (capsule biosynthesis protein)
LRQEADVVVVIYHGGREYVPSPPPYIVNRLRAIADAGASAVIAHHPHVPQGIEMYGETPIVYSQGNFVFWQENDLYYRHTGYLVHLDIHRKRIVGMQITPYLIERSGLSVMRGDAKSSFLNTLQAVSGLLAQTDAIRSVWNAFIGQIGLQGMIRLLKSGMNSIESDEPRGAEQLINAFFTPAHHEFYIDGFRRVADGQLGNSPEWAKAWLHHWHQYRLDEGKQSPEQTNAITASIEQMRRGASGR